LVVTEKIFAAFGEPYGLLPRREVVKALVGRHEASRLEFKFEI